VYEKFFEEIIVENFPNMEKEIVNQVQEAQGVPYRINPRRNMPSTVILPVDFYLLVLKIYPAIPFWPAECLLKDQLLNVWDFPCMLLVASPLLLLIFFLCV